MKKSTKIAFQEIIEYVKKCEKNKDYPFSFCKKDMFTIISFLELKLKVDDENN